MPASPTASRVLHVDLATGASRVIQFEGRPLHLGGSGLRVSNGLLAIWLLAGWLAGFLLSLLLAAGRRGKHIVLPARSGYIRGAVGAGECKVVAVAVGLNLIGSGLVSGSGLGGGFCLSGSLGG